MNFTVRQVAERLRVSTATVYQLCADQKLPHFRVGAGRGTIRIREEDLEDFLRRAMVQPKGPDVPRPSPPASTHGPIFTSLDGDRLLDAWRRQGVLADRQDGRSAPSS